MIRRRPTRDEFARLLAATLLFAATLPLLAPGSARAENARITGRVIDRETEKPIAGADVELANSAGGQGFFRAHTGADGRFTLERVPPERWYNLVAGAKGYADFTLPSWQFPAAQRGAELVIPLDRAGTLEVHVTTSDGHTPVPAAKVTIRSERGGREWEGFRPPPAARWTGADGIVSDADVDAQNWTVTIEAGGLLTQELRNVAVKRGEVTPITVKLAKPAQLAGTVTLADRSGVAGISITARGASEAVTTTGPGGDFSFGELAPGKYRIESSHDGFEPAAAKEMVTLREGESKGGITLTVTPRAADLAFVLNREVFTPGQTVKVGQRSFRVGLVDYALWKIPNDRLIDPSGGLHRAAAGDTSGLTRVDAWQRATADGPPYSWREEEIEVPGPLEPGAYLLTGASGALARRIVFFVSDVGLLVKRSPTKLLVSAASLRTGQPLGGVGIFIVPGSPQTPTRRAGLWSALLPPASAKRAVTDGRGLLMVAMDPPVPRVARVIAVSDFAGVSVVEAPVAGAAEQGGDQLFLYTDRPIYRPGQTVFFKAFVRKATPTGYAMPEASAATVALGGPDGASVAIPAATISAHGTFDGAAVIPAGAPLGDWSLSATAGRARATASVRVQEYRKPEFSVEAEPDRPTSVNGDEVRFRVAATYFFGSPVFGGDVRYTLFESRIANRDEASDEEGDDFEAAPQPSGYGRVLKSGESRLDRDGRVALAFVPERVSYDRTLTLEVEVVDGSNRAVSGRASTTMGRALFTIEVRPDRRVIGVGDVVPVEVSTHDLKGQPVAAAVTIELDQDSWNPLERRFTRSSRPLASLTVTTNSAGAAVARLVPAPARSGDLTVRARAEDSRGNPVSDETHVWVWDERVSDYAYRYPTLEAIPDRPRYSPGDTAKILVNTKVAGASVLAVVEGRELGTVQVVKIEGHTGLVRVPLSDRDAPNTFVALHVRKGKEVHSRVLELPVTAARHDLKIALTTDRSSYRPRETGTVKVDTRDASGHPVPAEVSVGVVDEAIYSLRRDETPDPHEVFYGRRPNWVTTVVAFPVLYYGGADKGGRDEVRRDFRDVALWAPTVTTGADGHAEVQVTFPDNLTTWRVTSRGATDDTRVGVATAKTLVTKDVVARLAGPRAFVAGDRADLVSVVTNRSGAALTGVEESIAASGSAKVSGPASRKSDLAPAGESRGVWAIETPKDLPADADEGTAVLTLHARAKNDADAVETRVPVVPHAVALTPHGGEVVDGASRSLAVTLPGNLIAGGSSVTIELAASPAAVAFAGLQALLAFPYSCTEQTSDAIRPACSLTAAARAAKVTPPGWEDPASRLRPYLERLAALASPQGGWGWWRENDVDPFMTALALDAIARAEKLELSMPAADATVDPGVMALLRSLNEVRNEDAEAYVLAHVTALLTRPDARPRWGGLVDWSDATTLALAAHADALSPAGQALAARALAELGRPREARVLLDALMKKSTSSGGLHWGAASPAEDSWFGDAIETTAFALSAMCAVAPEDARTADVAAWLAAERRGADWRSTRTSAPVVMALADYARTHAESMKPDLGVELAWNGARVLDQKLTPADAWRAQPLVVKVAGAKLKSGGNTLGVTRTGTGRVFLSWQGRVLVPSPGPSTDAEKRLHVTREYLRAERTTDRRGRPQILATPVGPDEPWKVGDAVLVRITLHADRALRWLIVEDPRVAGFEVEEALPEGAERPWGTHAEVRDRTVAFFVDGVEAGETVIEYLARPEIAGTFSALPISAAAMYDPELGVRGTEARLTVRAR